MPLKKLNYDTPLLFLSKLIYTSTLNHPITLYFCKFREIIKFKKTEKIFKG